MPQMSRRSGKLIRSECALRQSHGATESSHRQSTCNVDFDDDVGGKCDVSALICSTTNYVTQVPWSAACRPARTIRYTTTNHVTERDIYKQFLRSVPCMKKENLGGRPVFPSFQVQLLAFAVSFNSILHFQCNRSPFNRTWKKRSGEIDD